MTEDKETKWSTCWDAGIWWSLFTFTNKSAVTEDGLSIEWTEVEPADVRGDNALTWIVFSGTFFWPGIIGAIPFSEYASVSINNTVSTESQ